MHFLLIIALAVQVGASLRLPSEKPKRLPLQKKRVILKSPTSYAKRLLRIDQKTGEEIYYDPRPQVTLLDAKSGKYAFEWIGYDGRKKAVIYQRPDAIDAVVISSVSKTTSGEYLYVYNVQNLASSGQHLSGFAVQNFASDVNPTKIGEYVGRMSNNKELRDGNWIYFSITTFQPKIVPAREMEFKLVSSAPPGLVECRIHGGVMRMIGVGEDMPQELENVLPGYEIWPSGYTIGPIGNLKTLSPAERAKYVLQQLPRFKELGWMTADAFRWYQQNLNRIDLATISQHAEQDLGAGNITNEVLLMIQGIRQQP